MMAGPSIRLPDASCERCQTSTSCQKTARLVADELGIDESHWKIAFQSRVGRQERLKPYTDDNVNQLGATKLDKLYVIFPGFSDDCLETLEEISMQNAGFFSAAVGGELRDIPSLNDSAKPVSVMVQLLTQHASGWPESMPRNDPLAGLQDSLRRALTLGAER
jgi:ferrochelatase